jgi:superfamily II DNA/RNA helicase
MSHTGTGKTLSYLLPIIQHLKNEEENTNKISFPKRPRALVLAPTRELTEQIHDVAKSISAYTKFRLSVINAGKSRAAQKCILNKANDLLISTPNAFLINHEISNVSHEDLVSLVLDEADSLFAGVSEPEVAKIINLCNRKSKPPRYILISATLRKPIQKLILDQIPDLRELTSKTLHKGIGGTIHSFKKIPTGKDKISSLIYIVENELSKEKNLLIFCNTIKSCRAVSYVIADLGIECSEYHGEIPAITRRENFLKFLGNLVGNADDSYASYLKKKGTVMVCTDISARGLDFKSSIDHVINFDFPLNSIDYIHRSGRTGRAGSKGKVSSLVTKRELAFATRLEFALKNGKSLVEIKDY